MCDSLFLYYYFFLNNAAYWQVAHIVVETDIRFSMPLTSQWTLAPSCPSASQSKLDFFTEAKLRTERDPTLKQGPLNPPPTAEGAADCDLGCEQLDDWLGEKSSAIGIKHEPPDPV